MYKEENSLASMHKITPDVLTHNLNQQFNQWTDQIKGRAEKHARWYQSSKFWPKYGDK